jgi:hypothetical protein
MVTRAWHTAAGGQTLSNHLAQWAKLVRPAHCQRVGIEPAHLSVVAAAFCPGGAEALWEIAQGRGRKPQPGLSRKILEATLHAKPQGQTHWSTGSMAKKHGVHASTVSRIGQEHDLQPHRQETFKLSRDLQFVPKLLDVVGVYLQPPQNAIVLCVDEKSQIQALDRTQPGLPLKPGRCGTWTHDYIQTSRLRILATIC